MRGGEAAPHASENREQRTERAGAKRQTFHGHRNAPAGRPAKPWHIATRHPQRHKGPQSSARIGNRRLRRLEPIRGVLPHANGKVVHPKRRSRRPIGPIRPICPTASPMWHVADVPGVQGLWEAWKFRGLEAWLFYPSPHPSPRRGALCSLFTVFCSLGRVSALPCRGVGQRPTPFQSPIHSVPFVSFVAPRVLCGKSTLAVLPAVAGSKSALICVIGGFLILAVSGVAVGHIGHIGHVGRLGRRLTTLAQRPHPSRACRAFQSANQLISQSATLHLTFHAG